MKALPDGFEQACYDLKAIVRKRGVTSAGNLMLLAMFHLLNGCSLLEISEIARLTKLGKMSDVAFMKRFERCGEWFKWIAGKLKSSGMANYEKPAYLAPYSVLALDASDVAEKGRAGRIWRLHYALNIFEMCSEFYKITEQKIGETLLNFDFKPLQLVIADRAYSTIAGMKHCLKMGAEYILRMRANSFSLYDESGKKVDILYKLSKMTDGECDNISLFAGNLSGERLPVRLCATRKTPDAIAQTQKRLHQKESKKQQEISAETKLFNEYIVVVTSLPDTITAEQILETYRLRWQVEIQFKRLKSILGFGELPKRRSGSVTAWLNGKLMLALLIEHVIATVFSPEAQSSLKESMEGNEMAEIDPCDRFC
jgi:hypothetical protein